MKRSLLRGLPSGDLVPFASVYNPVDNMLMPPPPPAPPSIEGAQLILDLYMRRFEDKDHDASDQPATALTACEGSFSCVLVDSER